jgi:hypothetical protein
LHNLDDQTTEAYFAKNGEGKSQKEEEEEEEK